MGHGLSGGARGRGEVEAERRFGRAWGGGVGVKKKGTPRDSLRKDWRRPTFPQTSAVSSAMQGLTSLFGMGRGEHLLHSHQNMLPADCRLTIGQRHIGVIRKVFG